MCEEMVKSSRNVSIIRNIFIFLYLLFSVLLHYYLILFEKMCYGMLKKVSTDDRLQVTIQNNKILIL